MVNSIWVIADFLNGPYFSIFSIQLTVTMFKLILPMTGFDLQASVIGSNRSTN